MSMKIYEIELSWDLYNTLVLSREYIPNSNLEKNVDGEYLVNELIEEMNSFIDTKNRQLKNDMTHFIDVLESVYWHIMWCVEYMIENHNNYRSIVITYNDIRQFSFREYNKYKLINKYNYLF